MRANRAFYPVATMCRLLGVSASGYYAWQGRAPSARAESDGAMLDRIRDIHRASRGTYGTPRVHAELVAQGHAVGRKRIARLMRRAGLRGISRRKGTRTTVRDARTRAAPDLVERDFTADAPDRLWVADITYIPTWAGFLYLAVVLDAFSRRVVGWSMANHLRTQLVLDALDMALWQRRPDGVIHHSDQGSQYTSLAFGKRCRDAGVRPSCGRIAMYWLLDDTPEVRLGAAEGFRERAVREIVEPVSAALVPLVRNWMPPDAARTLLDEALGEANCGATGRARLPCRRGARTVRAIGRDAARERRSAPWPMRRWWTGTAM